MPDYHNNQEMSLGEAAMLLGIKYHRLLGWINRGKLPEGAARKVGWGWVLQRDHVQKLKDEMAKDQVI